MSILFRIVPLFNLLISAFIFKREDIMTGPLFFYITFLLKNLFYKILSSIPNSSYYFVIINLIACMSVLFPKNFRIITKSDLSPFLIINSIKFFLCRFFDKHILLFKLLDLLSYLTTITVVFVINRSPYAFINKIYSSEYLIILSIIQNFPKLQHSLFTFTIDQMLNNYGIKIPYFKAETFRSMKELNGLGLNQVLHDFVHTNLFKWYYFMYNQFSFIRNNVIEDVVSSILESPTETIPFRYFADNNCRLNKDNDGNITFTDTQMIDLHEPFQNKRISVTFTKDLEASKIIYNDGLGSEVTIYKDQPDFEKYKMYYKLFTILSNPAFSHSLTHIVCEDLQQLIFKHLSHHNPIYKFSKVFYGLGGAASLVSNFAFYNPIEGVTGLFKGASGLMYPDIDFHFCNDMSFDFSNRPKILRHFEDPTDLEEIDKNLPENVKFGFYRVGKQYYELAKLIVEGYFEENEIKQEPLHDTIVDEFEELLYGEQNFTPFPGSNGLERIKSLLTCWINCIFLHNSAHFTNKTLYPIGPFLRYFSLPNAPKTSTKMIAKIDEIDKYCMENGYEEYKSCYMTITPISV